MPVARLRRPMSERRCAPGGLALERPPRRPTARNTKGHRVGEPLSKSLPCVRASPWPSAYYVLCVLCSPLCPCSTLEGETEHDLRDPHEPGLRARRAEVGIADGVPAVQRAHVDTV